jgi:hypothetical protein
MRRHGGKNGEYWNRLLCFPIPMQSGEAIRMMHTVRDCFVVPGFTGTRNDGFCSVAEKINQEKDALRMIPIYVRRTGMFSLKQGTLCRKAIQ